MSDEAEDPLAEVGNKVGAGITTAMMGARMAVEVARRMRSDAITEWAATDSEDWKERVRTFNPELVDAYDKGITEGMDPAGARRYAADVVTTNAAVRSAERNQERDTTPDASTATPDRTSADDRSHERAATPAAGGEEAARIRVSEQHADMARRAARKHAAEYRKARDAGLPETQARRAAANAWHRTWERPARSTPPSEHVRPRTLGHYGDTAAPSQQPPMQANKRNPTKGQSR